MFIYPAIWFFSWAFIATSLFVNAYYPDVENLVLDYLYLFFGPRFQTIMIGFV